MLACLLQLLNENDNKPLFNEDVYYAEVSELAELGSVVATAVAVDKDNPSQPPFFSEQGVSDLFNVMIGGDITVAAPLDADVPDPEYNITVLAEDTIGFDNNKIQCVSYHKDHYQIPKG